ncbi:MAG: helix-turn-helix transcriptional regulator [Nitrospinae bacterium]|nr:helix-turn-helix transcriptional regulator [Nitrospinota bacterium]MCH8312265.1 helix-turn-helix transcriptional regulator [Nitrospinota bacterium]
MIVKHTPEQIGSLIRQTRKSLNLTQKDLALTSGTGLRFIIDLEKGKSTCQFAKVLTVLHTLGISLTLTPPSKIGKE